jgi:hypothetical protein
MTVGFRLQVLVGKYCFGPRATGFRNDGLRSFLNEDVNATQWLGIVLIIL